MKKSLIILFFGVFACFSGSFAATAPQSDIYQNPNAQFLRAKELFAERRYQAARAGFQEYLRVAGSHTEQYQQAGFFHAASGALAGADALPLLQNYVEKYPVNAYGNELSFLFGTAYFNQKDYKTALKYFEQTDVNKLGAPFGEDFLFMKGISLFETGQYEPAREIFSRLASPDPSKGGEPDSRAAYYYAYCEYLLGNDSEALPVFLKLENTAEYAYSVQYFLPQIYLQLGNFREAISRAEKVLAHNPNDEQNAELHRVLGEAYFYENNFLKSLENYEMAEENTFTREDLYLTGVANYRLENYREAIGYLSRTTQVDDALAQNAFLYIAQSYLALNDRNNARMAFESAARTEHDKAVQENALFNYAVSTYNTAFSPFNESVNAFRTFLDRFPNSENAPKAYEYLADVYLSSNNFEEAYNSIVTLQSQNPNILRAQQHLLFNMGVDAFNAPDLPKAIELFTKALNIPQGDKSTQAYFWRGEAYAQTGNQALAQTDFNRVLTAKNNAEFLPLVHYNTGYTYFAGKNYNAAKQSFLQYIEKESKTTPDKFIDALNRLGDCYFQVRDFDNAMKAYKKSADKRAPNSDYAFFQMAFIEGLQRNHRNKILLLDRLTEKYPKSDYLDDALFEKARAQVDLDEFKQAIATLDQLTTVQPNSLLAPRAIVQKALLYYNLKESEQSVALYKQVIERYPNSEEAQVAFESLEKLYLEMNQVEAFIAYSQQLKGQFSLDKAKEESLLFAAAEQHFAAERFTEARDLYAQIALQKGNPFAETAAEKAAGIYFEENNFSEAKRYFEVLHQVAQSRATAQTANLGILRSEVHMLNDEAVLTLATGLLAENITDTDVLRELRYYKAKALLELGRPKEAVPFLQELVKEPRTEQGAEAYFLLADCTFTEDKNAEKAEQIVMEFIEQGSPQQYWIARSFILLADMAIEANDDFQAKQYLLIRLKEIEERATLP